MSTRATDAWRPLAGLFVVALGASAPTMDLAVNVAFPAITAAFALDTGAIRWVVVCYVVTYSSLMLAFGKLGDHIGYRQVFRAGLLVGVAAFVLCALAPDYPRLLVARFVQGISTALVLSCAPALATSLFAERRRTRALGAYSGMLAAATIVAPLAGGASIAALGWSGVFWFRAPVALLALCALLLLPKLAPMPSSPRAEAFDRVGTALLAGGIASLLLAVSVTGFGIPTWIPLVPALAGTLALGAFVRRERRRPQPLVPQPIARDPDFLLFNVASIVVQFVAFAVPLLVPYHLARVSGFSDAAGGAVLAAFPIGMLAGSSLSVPVVRSLGARRGALAGAVVVSLGSVAIAFWPAHAALPAMLASLFAHGIGLGLFQVAYTDGVVATLPRHQRGVAGSLTLVTRTVGVVSAAALLTASIERMERTALALGAARGSTFASDFHAVFLCISGLLAAFLLLTCLRRRLWFPR